MAEAEGFNVAIRRASNPKKGEPSVYLTLDLECTKSREFDSKSTGKRSRGFVRSGCPWVGRMSFYKKQGAWKFILKNGTHNHSLCQEGAKNEPIRRRENRSGSLQKAAKDLLEMPNCSGVDVAEKLQRDNSGVVVYPRDIWNLNSEFKKEKYQGRTATQQFVYDLLQKQDNGEAHVEVLYEHATSNEQVRSVFWAYRDNIKFWKENPDVLLFDNTYKTNRFNMPLFEGNGVTGLSSTFNVCFALLPNESEFSFTWVFQKLRELAAKEGIRFPFVIVTDFDKAMKGAITNVFGDDVAMQICLWHVLKNVAFHIKTKWTGPPSENASEGITANDEQEAPEGDTAAGILASRHLDGQDREIRLGEAIRDARLAPVEPARSIEASRRYRNDPDGLLLAFRAAVYANTEKEFWDLWSLLKQEFSDQRGRVDPPSLFPKMHDTKRSMKISSVMLRGHGFQSCPNLPILPSRKTAIMG